MKRTLIIFLAVIIILGIAFAYIGRKHVDTTDSVSTTPVTTGTQSADSSPTVLVDTRACALASCSGEAGYVSIKASKDAKNVYVGDKVLAGADPATFLILKTAAGKPSAFAKDATHLYDIVNARTIGTVGETTITIDSETTAYVNGKLYSLAF